MHTDRLQSWQYGAERLLSLSTLLSDLHPQGEFVDDGTETHFTLGDHNCCVKAVSSGKRRDGIIHTLLVDGTEIAECTE